MMSDFPLPPVRSTSLSLFVDDIKVTTTKDSIGETELQPYLDKIGIWANENRQCVTPGKCNSLVFSRRKDPVPELVLHFNCPLIVPAMSYKFLGVTFDSRLSWIPHLKDLKTKLVRGFGLLKTLTWGRTRLGFRLLLRIYNALARSRIDYGAVVFSGLSNTKMNMVEKTQNELLRIILGCMKSTPIHLLNLETGIIPVKDRWEELTARYLINLDTKPWNPAYKTAWVLTSFNINWPVRSIPAIIPAIRRLRLLDRNIFCTAPSTVPKVVIFLCRRRKQVLVIQEQQLCSANLLLMNLPHKFPPSLMDR